MLNVLGDIVMISSSLWMNVYQPKKLAEKISDEELIRINQQVLSIHSYDFECLYLKEKFLPPYPLRFNVSTIIF
jgi:hypothetical protein